MTSQKRIQQGSETGRIKAIRHLPKIEIKNTLLLPLF